jgi:hypothetical protein
MRAIDRCTSSDPQSTSPITSAVGTIEGMIMVMITATTAKTIMAMNTATIERTIMVTGMTTIDTTTISEALRAVRAHLPSRNPCAPTFRRATL